MKLQNVLDNYYFHSGKVSDIARQLAFAAIAVIWLFKAGNGTSISLPKELLQPLRLVVVFLALDLLQYIFATVVWGIFHRIKEREGTSNSSEFKAPRSINWLALACFWSKIVVLAYAYWELFSYVRCIINQS